MGVQNNCSALHVDYLINVINYSDIRHAVSLTVSVCVHLLSAKQHKGQASRKTKCNYCLGFCFCVCLSV